MAPAVPSVYNIISRIYKVFIDNLNGEGVVLKIALILSIVVLPMYAYGSPYVAPQPALVEPIFRLTPFEVSVPRRRNRGAQAHKKPIGRPVIPRLP